jgi:hypothetical protein
MIKSTLNRIASVRHKRDPDFIIGGWDNPYMLRWHVIPRNRWGCVYVHEFLRDDDDRALHDHPWPSLTYVVSGAYHDHTISAGGINKRELLTAGRFKFRRPSAAHRVEIAQTPCVTVFMRGPVVREWGFHCEQAGWVHWKDFTADDDKGAVGKGCNQ